MAKKNDRPSFFDQVKKELEGIGNQFAEEIQKELISESSKAVVNSILSPSPSPTPATQHAPAPFQKAVNPALSSVKGFRENLTWLPGGQDGRANPVNLSAPTDHFHTSNPIARICPGDMFSFHFRVLKVDQGGKFLHSLQFMLADEKGVESGWCFNFQSGEEKPIKGNLKVDNRFVDNQDYVPPRYQVDAINEILITYDSKYMRSFVNGGQVPAHFIKSGAVFTLVFRVVGMEISFWG